MVYTSSLQPRLLTAFVGDRLVHSSQPLHHLFRFNQGKKYAPVCLSRTFSGLTDLLFSKRSQGSRKSGHKRLSPGKVSPCRPVPEKITRPPYVNSKQPPGIASGPELHDEMGKECMRSSGRLAAQVLEYAGTLVKPGITTDEIDEAVHQMIIDNGAYPSPLGYGGFPKSVCTSVNECICHGIPDSRALEDGDIINIDVTVYLNGYHGDTSKTFFCGDVDAEARQLVEVTKECLYKAIVICAPGVEFKKIGKTIHDHADKYRFGVVRQFVGHGVGQVFHADPVILHYRNNDAGRMVLGQTFTIVAAGTRRLEQASLLTSNRYILLQEDSEACNSDKSSSGSIVHQVSQTSVPGSLPATPYEPMESSLNIENKLQLVAAVNPIVPFEALQSPLVCSESECNGILPLVEPYDTSVWRVEPNNA